MRRAGITKTVFVGSPDVTIFQDARMGFDRYGENNAAVLAIANRQPDTFYAFPTLYPLDAGNVQRLDEYVAQGAAGLKLYYGLGADNADGPFHVCPLDDPRMDPVFARCRELDLPIIFHVNRVKFYEEQLRLLKKWPDLKVCFPHIMVSTKSDDRLARVAKILAAYPRVYTDCSHGRENHLVSISLHMTHRRDSFRAFFERWQRRIMFGTDLVITRAKFLHLGDYLERMVMWYRASLERDAYAVAFADQSFNFRGLALAPATLDQIYSGTFDDFIRSRVRRREIRQPFLEGSLR
jgi:predicted TIM-barrel fold metal-dependent hydrolase